MPDWRSVRLIRDEIGRIAPDVTGRLGGPSVWVLADSPIIRAAIKDGAFAAKLSAAFDAPVRAPQSADEFCRLCDKQLQQQIARLMGLELRAGRLAIGVEVAGRALKSGKANSAILAIDVAPNSAHLIEAQSGGSTAVSIFRLLEMREMGAALGREMVGCVAFDRFRTTTRLPEELLRLAAFRGKALPGSTAGGPQPRNSAALVEEQDG